MSSPVMEKVSVPATEKPPITVTEKAAAKVKSIISEGQQRGELPEKVHLRVRVEGGGCSGFQNKLDLDPEVKPNDQVFDFYGVPLVVDKYSLIYLNGATIDYHEDLNRQGFSIQNPNAKSTCGCGSSYSM